MMPRGRRVMRLAAIAQYYPYASKRHCDAARRLADHAVKNALASGELVRQPCQVCGRNRLIEGHHEDYNQPLFVVWLCRYHHRLRHADLREQAYLALRAEGTSGLPTPKFLRRTRTLLTMRQIFAEAHQEAERHRTIELDAFKAMLRPRRTAFDADPLIASVIEDVSRSLAVMLISQGMTQIDVAAKLGCSRQFVSASFASGIRTIKALVSYANAIGCDVKVDLVRRGSPVQTREIAS